MDYRWLAISHMLDVRLRTPRHANQLNRFSPPGNDINSIVAALCRGSKRQLLAVRAKVAPGSPLLAQ
jgi:hypothetical protein